MSRGSNLKAMAQYFESNNLPIEISFVVHTRQKAPIREVCEALNIKAVHVPYRDSMIFETKVLELVKSESVELIALAGFLKLLSKSFFEQAAIPIFNIHPALLPAYGGKGMYGTAVHKAVFEAQEQKSGVTVHFVDPIYDHGHIFAQESVDISACASPEEIAKIVLGIEHSLYGRAIRDFFKLY